LHVLSQIEGVDLEMYKDVVLPRVLEQVNINMINPFLDMEYKTLSFVCSNYPISKDAAKCFHRLSIVRMRLPNII